MTDYAVLPHHLSTRDIGMNYSRGSLGVEHGRPEGCDTCGAEGRDMPARSLEAGIPLDAYNYPAQKGVNITRINIGGNWSYLCDDCFQTLWMLHLGEDVSARLAGSE